MLRGSPSVAEGRIGAEPFAVLPGRVDDKGNLLAHSPREYMRPFRRLDPRAYAHVGSASIVSTSKLFAPAAVTSGSAPLRLQKATIGSSRGAGAQFAFARSSRRSRRVMGPRCQRASPMSAVRPPRRPRTSISQGSESSWKRFALQRVCSARAFYRSGSTADPSRTRPGGSGTSAFGAASKRLRRVQRPGQVGDEVGGSLDADREADERRRDLKARARHRGMGHRRRELDE